MSAPVQTHLPISNAMPLETKLCKACQSFDVHSFSTLLDNKLVRRVSDIARAAEAGCDFCQMLYQNAREHYAAERYEYELLPAGLAPDSRFSKLGQLMDYFVWIYLSGSEDDSVNIPGPKYNKIWVTISREKIWLGDASLGRSRKRFDHELCLAADMTSAAYQSGMVGGRFLGHDRTSPEYASALMYWINNCVTTHAACRTAISSPNEFDPYNVPLPTRCVEITTAGAYLRETRGLTGSYVTLSHRWNTQGASCKTTVSNYSTRMAGSQNLEAGVELSKTFKDAIAVTRSLGFKYLWIDSLCIIQEPEDWNSEKVMMGVYYQHAVFTLAAITQCSSSVPIDGFLQTPDLDLEMTRLPYREKNIRKGSVYVYRQARNSNLQYVQDIDRSELLSRGWIFQERVLSRRIIYFTGSETFMECESRRPVTIRGDEVRTGLPPDRRRFGYVDPTLHQYDELLKFSFKMDARRPSRVIDWIFPSWYSCCEDYSTSDLTVATDRLDAISGIAGEYLALLDGIEGSAGGKGKGKASGQSYLSGIWLQDIHRGLVWRGVSKSVLGFADNHGQLTGAPTWSWLSYLGRTKWVEAHKNMAAVLEVINVVYSEDLDVENTSPLTTMATRLTVRSRVQPVLIRGVSPNEDEERTIFDITTGVDTKTLEPRAVSERGASIHNAVICSPEKPSIIGGWASFENKPDNWVRASDINKVYTCLHVATRKRLTDYQLGPEIFKIGSDAIEVIFVEPVENGAMRRIGMGMIFDVDLMEGFEQADFGIYHLE